MYCVRHELNTHFCVLQHGLNTLIKSVRAAVYKKVVRRISASSDASHCQVSDLHIVQHKMQTLLLTSMSDLIVANKCTWDPQLGMRRTGMSAVARHKSQPSQQTHVCCEDRHSSMSHPTTGGPNSGAHQ